jgi:hypothetical protein
MAHIRSGIEILSSWHLGQSIFDTERVENAWKRHKESYPTAQPFRPLSPRIISAYTPGPSRVPLKGPVSPFLAGTGCNGVPFLPPRSYGKLHQLSLGTSMACAHILEGSFSTSDTSTWGSGLPRLVATTTRPSLETSTGGFPVWWAMTGTTIAYTSVQLRCTSFPWRDHSPAPGSLHGISRL